MVLVNTALEGPSKNERGYYTAVPPRRPAMAARMTRMASSHHTIDLRGSVLIVVGILVFAKTCNQCQGGWLSE